MKKILFIIGSLRKQSFNRELSEMVRDMLKGRAEVTELDYSQVPFINQDDEYPAPQAVAEARRLWPRPMAFGFSLRSITIPIRDV